MSGRSPGTSRKDYSLLGENFSSQDSDGQTEDKQEGGVKVRWKNHLQDEEHNGESEMDKGHVRSTSLDLNKMLLADSNSDGERKNLPLWYFSTE